MADFKDRLNEALEMRNMKPADLSKKTGIGEGAISQYRKGAYRAKQWNIDKMARALNVSPSWLMGTTDDPRGNDSTHRIALPPQQETASDLTTDELELITDYRSLNQQGKEYIRQTMEMVVKLYPPENDAATDLEAAQ